MEDRLWKAWAACPWHAWMKDQPLLGNIVVSAMVRLPMSITTRLLQPVRPLVVLPPPTVARAIRVHAAMSAGANIIQLDASLALRPLDEAIAIIAHEVAHLVEHPTGYPEQDDLRADALAASWGFGPELHKALTKDLGPAHLRTIALAQHGLSLMHSGNA